MCVRDLMEKSFRKKKKNLIFFVFFSFLLHIRRASLIKKISADVKLVFLMYDG